MFGLFHPKNNYSHYQGDDWVVPTLNYCLTPMKGRVAILLSKFDWARSTYFGLQWVFLLGDTMVMWVILLSMMDMVAADKKHHQLILSQFELSSLGLIQYSTLYLHDC